MPPTYLPQYPQLTPVMRSVLERMHRAPYPPMYTLSAWEAKTQYEKGAEVLEVPRAELARVEDFTIPTRDGYAMPARLYAPTQGSHPVLVYFHGGGFTIGSIATHDILCRELSRLTPCAVISVDYRLAPEYKFPVAFDDARDAVQWIAAHAGQQLGLDTKRLAVGGDSAGGTLAAAGAIMARDERNPLALQLLFYPGTAENDDAPSHRRFAEGLVLEKPHIDWFFDQFIPKEQRADWRFAPLNAPDVEGVAPAWFGLAELDPIVDDCLAYADKLRLSGVPVDMEIYRGVTHEFIKMGRALPEARQAHRDAARALAEAFDIRS